MENITEKQVIKVGDTLVSVDTDIYQAYYKMERHERYLKEAEQKNCVYYYSSIDNQDTLGEELLMDSTRNVEDEVLDSIEKKNYMKLFYVLQIMNGN